MKTRDSGMKSSESCLRLAIREVMEPYEGGPDATILSLVVDIFVILCILVSCVLVVLNHFYPDNKPVFQYLEYVFTGIFTVEYLLRWYAAKNRLLYPFEKFAVIDLLAIAPSILMMAQEMLMLRMLRGIRLLRILRLLRLLRFLKFFRYGFLIYRGVLISSMRFSDIKARYHLGELGKLFFYTVLTWIFGANLLYLTECWMMKCTNGPFSDYWKSYWHIVIVLVSGIEDKEPVTLPGKIIVTMLLVAGICFIGMLTGEIVSILVRKIQRSGMAALKPGGSAMTRHIVIIGLNEHVDNIIRQVHAATAGLHFILVVGKQADRLKISDAHVFKRVRVLQGDPLNPAVLKEACISEAIRVVVLSESEEDKKNGDIDNDTLMKTLAAICHNRKLPMVVELREEKSLRYAKPLEGVEFMVGRFYGEKLAAQAVLNPGVTEIYNSLMTFTGDSNEFYTIRVPEELVGKTFSEARLFFLDLDDEPIIPAGIDRSPEESPNTNFMLNPMSGKNGDMEKDPVLRKEDRLIVLAFQRPSFDEAGREEIWSGKTISRI